MTTNHRYLPEHLLLLTAMALTVTGFWDVFGAKSAQPTAFHYAHTLTTSAWLVLLMYQLRLVRGGKYQDHRRAGLAVLGLAPLLVATVALLSVHSAQKGIASGKGDFLVVQNVGVTLDLVFLIFVAFLIKKRRALHGAFLLSTAVLFIGIALFFTLMSFVPTMSNRFMVVGAISQGICLAIGLLFVIRDRRNGWPILLAGVLLLLNEVVNQFLRSRGLIEPLTEFVASLNLTLTFVVSFALYLASLLAAGVQPKSGPNNSSKPTPLRGAA